MLLCIGVSAQTPDKTNTFLDHAEVRHDANVATVIANSPRPLEQTIAGVSEEYGWTVDYEDLPFRSLHGGTFQSRYPEDTNTGSSVAEERKVLDKVVSDYNQSGNPGKFSVREEGGDRFSIVGIAALDETGADRQIPSVLDTPISVPSRQRSGYDSIQAVLGALTAQSGTTVYQAATPLNTFLRMTVTVGGDNVPARALLKQIIAATHPKFYWDLLYDTHDKAYYFNLAPVMQANYDASGKRTTDFAH